MKRQVLLLAMCLGMMYGSGAASDTVTEIDQQTVKQFKQRSDTKVHPPPRVELEAQRFLLLKGAPSSEGGCLFPPVKNPATPESGNRVLTTIEIAVDRGACEKIVQQGYRKRGIAPRRPPEGADADYGEDLKLD